ncbi:uncharacterized protein LOC133420655 [Cololabis saira]|uniref:uncharacterized protein LOC133420229 n=1 Tax=Cololabis saira TaxID=129043 RepID=UPI002AD229AE|nr:uncharacterized protein LOC133420229 [Cololabis saira]XP_061566395.1 uncharacterized protein LOC133420655 [Cololabis saira]
MTTYLFLVILTFILIVPMITLPTILLNCYPLLNSYNILLGLLIIRGTLLIECTLDVGTSDHFCIFFNVAWTTKMIPGSKLVKRRTIAADTAGSFIAKYTNTARLFGPYSYSNLDFTPSPLSSCDNLINDFSCLVTQIMDDIVPIKTKLISGKTKTPWRNVKTVRALKRNCRKSERKWRKTKLQADYKIYKNMLSTYNKEIKQSRQQYFSQIITDNSHNAKFLFSTIDKLINPPRPIPTEFHSSDKCNEFASYFKSKILNIRNNIAGGRDPSPSAQHHSASTLSNFTLTQCSDIQEVVQQLSSVTCSLAR